jgi:spermidine synthase
VSERDFDPNAPIARAHTAIGDLVLRRRELQAEPGVFFVELLVDDRMLMSDFNARSERALARASVARSRGEDLRVLVGGLGLGHTAHEALASARVTRLDVVEYVPELVAWFEALLIPLAAELRADPRFGVIVDDVYARLQRPAAERYDLILVDVDHAPDDPLAATSGSFYTADGLRRVCAHLAPGGLLAVWSYAENRAFETTLREVFADVETETTVFQDHAFWHADEINTLFFASGPFAERRSGPRPAPGPLAPKSLHVEQPPQFRR